MLEQVEANTGVRPDKKLADAGYRSESNLQELEEREIEGFVAFGCERSGIPKRVDPELEATGRMARPRAPRGTYHNVHTRPLGQNAA